MSLSFTFVSPRFCRSPSVCCGSRQRSSQQVFMSKNTRRDAGGKTSSALLLFFPSPVFSLLYFFYFLNSNALFFPLALANHSSLIKLLQKSLSMSLDVISLLAAWILSLTHANTPPFLSIPSASKVFHCCDCQKETLLGSV